ncbi:MAG: preprotein translocase subunit SecY [Patescibacteria group bacterium]
MNRILQLFKRPELRSKVFFILALLAVSRVVSNIPLSVLDAARLQEFFANNQLLGLLSAFTGGALSRLSIGLLGLGPYITASIIMQLLTMIFPSMEQLYKYEGEAGRAKFNQYSRMLTVPLAALQGFSFLKILMQQGLITALSPIDWIVSISVIIASSVFLMWLGELITEKNLGNGVSLLILAGIVSAFPSQIQQAAFTYTPDQITTYIGFILVSLVVIVGVVYISEAQRNIPITYARRVRGSKMIGGVSTYLPMRVNNAGVIPIIFALSMLLFPGIAANFLAGSSIPILARVATLVNNFVQNQVWYSIMYFFLVVLFTYFYTAISFDPKSISENIQKQGGYIPGIRPGPMTAAFLNNLLNKVTLVGALFLGLIAVLPNIVRGLSGISAFSLGGTSVLIVVSVALEVMKQVDAQLSMYEY